MYNYGDEIGMTTIPPAHKENVRDPIDVRGRPNEKGRDDERTPTQWTAGPNAGFSSNGAKTWLAVPPNATTVSVAAQEGPPDTLLAWYRQLGTLQRTNAALRDGEQVMLNTSDSHVLAWLRRTPKGEAVLFACNFTAPPQKVSLDPKTYDVHATIVSALLSTPGQETPRSLTNIAPEPFGVAVL